MQATPLSDRLGIALQARPGQTLADLDPPLVQDAFRKHGAVLLRGFSGDTDGFKAFTDRLCHDYSDYSGGGMRVGILNRQAIGNDPTLMTVTGHTQGFSMALHGEMYYLRKRPRILWFYCQTPPADGHGQTTVCDGAELWAALPPEVQSYFQQNRLAYHRHLADGAWQTTFFCEDLEQARALAAAQCDHVQVDLQERWLETREVFPATLEGPDGRPVYINSMASAWDAEWAFESGWIQQNLGEGVAPRCPMVVRTEAGERIPRAIREEVERVAESLTVEVNWQAGDVLMVDNAWMMHGRRQARDKNRSILIRMGEPRF
ncbi:MAG: TauD/TfdA family dioxygenase [Candidatus Eremiobacterota bacterium]